MIQHVWVLYKYNVDSLWPVTLVTFAQIKLMHKKQSKIHYASCAVNKCEGILGPENLTRMYMPALDPLNVYFVKKIGKEVHLECTFDIVVASHNEYRHYLQIIRII